MQSAVTLAKRGFDVTLFEKEDTLGGTMNLADKGPHKEKITRFVETMKAEVERAGVKVLLGKAPSIARPGGRCDGGRCRPHRSPHSRRG